ncbi:MAG: branched-chain amino acid aminotransferase [Caldiserica bacterium]|nr:MAG: branched-chain amino acid aminotransferase [Caldisericota bacterium]
MDELKIWLNGKIVKRSEAVISVFDHGLLYGDGVFEGIRAYNGRVFRLDKHIERLYNSAKAIMLEIPLSKKEMKEAIIQTLKANKLKDAYIRVVVTRGEGDLGLDPRKCPNPNIFIITDKIVLYPKEFYENGLKIVTASTRRNIPEAIDPRIKSLNYLNNILAKIEANLKGVPEALMLNREGYVAECTGDNIFIVRDGRILTPPFYVGVLRGITRETVIEIAVKILKMEVVETPFTLFHLYTSEECFLTGTAAEVIPVTEVDGRKIGDGKVGRITKRIMAEFRKLTRAEGTKYEIV